MKPTLQMHDFYADGIADFNGDPRCGVCHLPKKNRSHQIPETPAEAAAVEARILGEHEEG